jgi:hypothetical protein
MKKKSWTPRWQPSSGSRQKNAIKADAAGKTAAIDAAAQQWGVVLEDQRAVPTDVVAGNWYFAVNCENCGSPIALVRDPTQGGHPLSGPGSFRVTCPRAECVHDGGYSTAEVTSLEAREGVFAS